MTPEGRKRFSAGGGSSFADDVVRHAAFEGLDRGKSCRMYFTAKAKERDLLQYAYRKIKAGDMALQGARG